MFYKASGKAMKRAIDTTGDLFDQTPSDFPRAARSKKIVQNTDGVDGVMKGYQRGDEGVGKAVPMGDGVVMTGGSVGIAGGVGGVIEGGSCGEKGVLRDGQVMPTLAAKPKKTVVTRYGKQAFSQPYLFVMDEEGEDAETADRDPLKIANEAYRVRRDVASEALDMPLALLALDIRAGIEKDDRKWNAIFDQAREEIVKEISYLRLVLGDKMKVEVDWQLPLRWPYIALRAPDGKRIVDTDSLELRAYGVRSASLLWSHILEKQQLMKKMARDYNALTHWAFSLPKNVSKAMAGTRSSKFVMTPQIANQINRLQWLSYRGEDTGGAFCPLPFNLYESVRLRHWAVAEALKNHVIYMNMIYNLVQKESSQKFGTPRRAGLAVRITTGKADIPVTSWALWINHRMNNLFYTTVTPRIRSKKHGKYISAYSFRISDEKGRLIGESIHRAHLSHMADVYRAVDSVLAELQKLANKSGLLMQKIMGYRHAKDSPAAAGKASWRPSGRKLKWLPEQ